LDGQLPKFCPVIPTSNQDGRQAKNRKRGDEIKKNSSPLKLGWKSGSPDKILEVGHPRIIPQKFGCNWPSGF
jgi:hypothetical protein